jgi:hypothetical protein
MCKQCRYPSPAACAGKRRRGLGRFAVWAVAIPRVLRNAEVASSLSLVIALMSWYCFLGVSRSSHDSRLVATLGGSGIFGVCVRRA